MVRAIIFFEENDRSSCIAHPQTISYRLRHLLLIFFDGLMDAHVSRSVCLNYIQGFQGWGFGRMVNGEFAKCDGLSGNHVLFFQALDAFLSMDRYLTDKNMIRYISVNQRELCLAFKKYSFRNKITGQVDVEIEVKVRTTANQLKVSFALTRI